MTCTAPSHYSFTPGCDYPSRRGEHQARRMDNGILIITPGVYYEIVDDTGVLHHFTNHPRKGVPNEHPIDDLWTMFPKPDEDCPSPIAHRPFASGRVLIIAPRFNRPDTPGVAQWHHQLEKDHIKVHPIRTILELNRLLIENNGALPPAVYLTHLKGVFLTPQGTINPGLEGQFDYLLNAL